MMNDELKTEIMPHFFPFCIPASAFSIREVWG